MNDRQKRFEARHKHNHRIDWTINILLLLIVAVFFWIIFNLAFDIIGRHVCDTASVSYAQEHHLNCELK